MTMLFSMSSKSKEIVKIYATDSEMMKNLLNKEKKSKFNMTCDGNKN